MVTLKISDDLSRRVIGVFSCHINSQSNKRVKLVFKILTFYHNPLLSFDFFQRVILLYFGLSDKRPGMIGTWSHIQWIRMKTIFHLTHNLKSFLFFDQLSFCVSLALRNILGFPLTVHISHVLCLACIQPLFFLKLCRTRQCRGSRIGVDKSV